MNHNGSAPKRRTPREAGSRAKEAVTGAKGEVLFGDCTPNDAGRAARFVMRFGSDIRFVPERKYWLVWDGNRWCIDRDGAIERRAVEMSREMLVETASTLGADRVAMDLRKYSCNEALLCGDRRNISDYMALAQVDKRVLLPAAKLDADRWLVGAKNGIIDLRTGIVRPTRVRTLSLERSGARLIREPLARGGNSSWRRSFPTRS